MTSLCSFWRCCFPAHSNEKPEIGTELPTLKAPENIKITLTAAIYNSDGTIKWDDPFTRNLLYSKGKEHSAIENYEFLYDCYKMRVIVQDKKIDTDAERDQLVRTLAKELFLKHITDESADLLVYYVEINNQKERVRNSINISGNLREKFKAINLRIDTATHKELLDLYEKAADELKGSGSLELPRLAPAPRNISFSSFFNNLSRRGANGESNNGNSRNRGSDKFKYHMGAPWPWPWPRKY